MNSIHLQQLRKSRSAGYFKPIVMGMLSHPSFRTGEFTATQMALAVHQALKARPQSHAFQHMELHHAFAVAPKPLGLGLPLELKWNELETSRLVEAVGNSRKNNPYAVVLHELNQQVYNALTALAKDGAVKASRRRRKNFFEVVQQK